MVRARLVPREHNDIWEPVNGDEWLKWSGALARSPLGVFNQQPHLPWLLALTGTMKHPTKIQFQALIDLQKMTFNSTMYGCAECEMKSSNASRSV